MVVDKATAFIDSCRKCQLFSGFLLREPDVLPPGNEVKQQLSPQPKKLCEFSSILLNYPFHLSGDLAIKEMMQRETVGLERSTVLKHTESSSINALIVFITQFPLNHQTQSLPISSPRSQMFNIPDRDIMNLFMSL